MPVARISGFLQSDTVLDLPAHATALAVVTGGNNYRITNAELQSVPAPRDSDFVLNAPSFWLLAGENADGPWWLSLGAQTIEAIQRGTVVDVTGALVLNTSVVSNWSGGILHGVAVMTNGIDNPVFWAGGDATTLLNWPPADVTTCTAKVIKSYRNFLVAMNLTENGVEYPELVRWSHPADPGALPTTWEATDPGNDSGRYPLSETPGSIVDGLALGELFLIYKNSSIYAMQFIGGTFIMRFSLFSVEAGALSHNCVVNIGRAHVVLAEDDVVLVSQSGVESIAHARVRREIFSRITLDNSHRCFVALNRYRSEVWIAIPGSGDAGCDTAFVWNYRENKWQMIELANVVALCFARKQFIGFRYDQASEPYSSIASTYNNAVETYTANGAMYNDFDGVTYNPVSAQQAIFIGARFGERTLQIVDEDDTEFTASLPTTIEHYSYDFASETNTAPADRIKHITRVCPHFTPETLNGTIIQFQIGVQMELHDTINWTPARNFTVGTNKDVFVRKNGRYISWRVSSVAGTELWGLDGMDVLFELGGIY